jgi:hypothetical protein
MKSQALLVTAPPRGHSLHDAHAFSTRTLGVLKVAAS